MEQHPKLPSLGFQVRKHTRPCCIVGTVSLTASGTDTPRGNDGASAEAQALHVPDAAIVPHVIQLVGRGQTPSEPAEIDIQAVKAYNKKKQGDGVSPDNREEINR